MNVEGRGGEDNGGHVEEEGKRAQTSVTRGRLGGDGKKSHDQPLPVNPHAHDPVRRCSHVCVSASVAEVTMVVHSLAPNFPLTSNRAGERQNPGRRKPRPSNERRHQERGEFRYVK